MTYARPPERPEGASALAVWQRQLLKYIESTMLRSVLGAKTIPDARGGFHLVIPKPLNGSHGGTSTFPWQKPQKELDPTVAVSKDTFVYISPLNPLVSPGLVDLISGNITMSRPGIWQAAQDVPVKNGLGKYNVPQTPLPGAGGVPSGSPLSGDADGANVFWLFWAPTPYC